MFTSLQVASASERRAVRGALVVGIGTIFMFAVAIWFLGSRNPFTPAGYVGYLTKGAVIGQSRFYGTQRGPTSAGRTWLLDVTNVSVTPYTYTENFTGEDAVLSRDNLKIAFRVHTVWRIDDTRIPIFMERFSTTMTRAQHDKEPDSIVQVAYGNFVREPLKTYARDEVQRRNGLEVKDALIQIGDAVPEPHPTVCRGQSVCHFERGRGERPVPGRSSQRGVPQARGDAGASAQGHGD